MTVAEKQAALRALAARNRGRFQIQGIDREMLGAEVEPRGVTGDLPMRMAAPMPTGRVLKSVKAPSSTSVHQRIDADMRRRLSVENDVPRSVLDRAIRKR